MSSLDTSRILCSAASDCLAKTGAAIINNTINKEDNDICQAGDEDVNTSATFEPRFERGSDFLGNRAILDVPKSTTISIYSPDNNCSTMSSMTPTTHPFTVESPDRFEYSEKSKIEIASLNEIFKVLVIDDSAICRATTQNRLSGTLFGKSWEVQSKESGERALEDIFGIFPVKDVANDIDKNSNKNESKGVKITRAETYNATPDVIIVDYYLEGAGGKLLGDEVVRLIRQRPEFQNIVIIGCSSSARTANLFFQAGCDSFWSKPIPCRDDAISCIYKLLFDRLSMHFPDQPLSSPVNVYKIFPHFQKKRRAADSSKSSFDVDKFIRNDKRINKMIKLIDDVLNSRSCSQQSLSSSSDSADYEIGSDDAVSITSSLTFHS